GQNNSKTVANVPEARVVPAAGRTAHEPVIEVERAATHHAAGTSLDLDSLPPIRRIVRVSGQLTTRPFPHIAYHIQATIGADPLGENAGRCRIAMPQFITVALSRIKCVAPWILALILVATRCLLPLRLRGQRDSTAAHATQPGAVS